MLKENHPLLHVAHINPITPPPSPHPTSRGNPTHTNGENVYKIVPKLQKPKKKIC